MRARGIRWAVAFVGIAVAVLGASALRTRARVAQVSEIRPPQGRFVAIDGMRLHYERAGSGPAVLLIHGCPGSIYDWHATVGDQESVFDSLAKDHTVIALDRPGNGWSEGRPHRPADLDEQVALMPKFLDALGLSSAVFVGHSYGGAVITSTAVRHPDIVDGLVSVAGAHYPGIGPDSLERLQLVPVVGSLLEWCLVPVVFDALFEQGLAGATGPNPLAPGYAKYVAPFYARPSNVRQIAFEIAVLSPQLEPVTSEYPSITVPTYAIIGDADAPILLRDARRLTEDVPGATLQILPGIGHFTQHNSPEPVANAVRAITGVNQPAEPEHMPATADAPSS